MYCIGSTENCIHKDVETLLLAACVGVGKAVLVLLPIYLADAVGTCVSHMIYVCEISKLLYSAQIKTKGNDSIVG